MEQTMTDWCEDERSLVRFVERRLPDEMLVPGGLQTLGLVSYSPHINTPSLKGIKHPSVQSMSNII